MKGKHHRAVLLRVLQMAGNRRGMLKEELEGLHRNMDWIVHHSMKAMSIIQDDNPKLAEFFECIGKQTEIMDKICQQVYSTI